MFWLASPASYPRVYVPDGRAKWTAPEKDASDLVRLQTNETQEQLKHVCSCMLNKHVCVHSPFFESWTVRTKHSTDVSLEKHKNPSS